MIQRWFTFSRRVVISVALGLYDRTTHDGDIVGATQGHGSEHQPNEL